MTELASNIVDAGPGKISYDPIFRSLPLGWFVGKFVKTTFRTRPRGKEHMWVKITGHKYGKLHGTLANEPGDDCGVGWGDEVSVSRTRIINVLSWECA